MQNRFNAVFDVAQMYQAIGVRRLIKFGVIMGIALAGQILVTISLGTLPWIQQHIIFMVVIELIWWPPFFVILYLAFSGVVKLVKQSLGASKQLRTQYENVCQDYEARCKTYELLLEEQKLNMQRALAARERMRSSRFESMH